MVRESVCLRVFVVVFSGMESFGIVDWADKDLDIEGLTSGKERQVNSFPAPG
jgi:hypothetical protein